MRIALVLALFGCNAGDRGAGPLSGSAGLSAGEESSGGGEEASDEAGSSGASASATSSTSGDDAADGSAGSSGGAATSSSSGDGDDTSSSSGSGSDGGSESSGGLADGILDIVVTAHDDCTFTTDPASITVPEGTEFTVNWVSSAASEVEFDIAKIDDFNQVAIVLGMEPGTSYHDEVREWCGLRFTGTFDFRVTSCFDHHYIPVDCGG